MPLTRKLQVTVALSSIVFTIGTALHNFLIIDTGLVETMMRMAGGADPAADAPGFTAGLQTVGTVYLLANAAGVLALWARSRLLWWLVLTVNVTQACGVVVIPSSMWTAVWQEHGFAGVLPSAVTDGGAVILSLVMIAVLVRFRAPWADSAGSSKT